MSSIITNLLNKNLERKSLRTLSLNKESTKHKSSVLNLINSDKKCFDFDRLNQNNKSVDCLEFRNETYYFIEFKDERVYNFSHNWAKTMAIISKVFQSMNEILTLYINNEIPKNEFYDKKLKFIIVFSSLKSTDFNDFRTLQIILTEKYGSILDIDIVNETIFLNDYVNNDKIGLD